MNNPPPPGFVTSLKWSIEALNGQPVRLPQVAGKTQPAPVRELRRFSARRYDEGMILEAFMIDAGGKRQSLPLSQAQVNNLRKNQAGEFEI